MHRDCRGTTPSSTQPENLGVQGSYAMVAATIATETPSQ